MLLLVYQQHNSIPIASGHSLARSGAGFKGATVVETPSPA
jgi:hypothetical protein